MNGSSTLAPAIIISRGGIELLGDTQGDTMLLGNGAWILNNGFVQRGVIFGCVGPVTNNYPLVFRNLSFNGGVPVGNLNYGTGPADPVTGGGWDITHDAVVDMGEPPYHTNKFFINCSFEHWRGEMVKSVVAWTAGFVGITTLRLLGWRWLRIQFQLDASRHRRMSLFEFEHGHRVLRGLNADELHF